MIKISLESAGDIERFVQIANTYHGDVNIRSVRNHSVVVDGKSFISVIRLDLNDDLEVELITSDENELMRFTNGMKQFSHERKGTAC